MKNLMKLRDLSLENVEEIFRIADGMAGGEYPGAFGGKTFALFFQESSMLTRCAFEKGIHLLGGLSIHCPPGLLDKREKLEDIAGYLNNWADCLVIRHSSMERMTELAASANVPVVNAMTSTGHPCEILTDLYALSKLREEYLQLQYVFVGRRGNIANTWAEAAKVCGFAFRQSCPQGYELPGVAVEPNLDKALAGADVILTDSLPPECLEDFLPYQITAEKIALANDGALLNPCPPFYRGEEVSADAIACEAFVGYGFKKNLIPVQQAILHFLLAGA